MKKLLSTTLAIVLVFTSLFALGGCNKGEAIDPNRTQIYVSVQDLGVGNAFLTSLKQKYEAYNPKAQIMPITGGSGQPAAEIQNGGYDVYFFTNADMNTYVKTLLLEQFALKNNHIHSGFLGIRFILPVLCQVGLVDLAYELICCDTYPSWGYSIANGATTIWERWDSYTVDKGFQSEDMNSFNHYSLGSCGEWFYEYMLGISPIEPAFSKVRIKPFVDRSGRINSANGYFDSLNGKISVDWDRSDDGFICNIDKPESIFAEFAFDNVKKIVQDGVVVVDFNPYAKKTTVFFD